MEKVYQKNEAVYLFIFFLIGKTLVTSFPRDIFLGNYEQILKLYPSQGNKTTTNQWNGWGYGFKISQETIVK